MQRMGSVTGLVGATPISSWFLNMFLQRFLLSLELQRKAAANQSFRRSHLICLRDWIRMATAPT